MGHQREYLSSHASETINGTRTLEVRILTPAFYSRFVHYASTSAAFDRESRLTDDRNRTVWISEPDLLVDLLSQPRPRRPKHGHQRTPLGIIPSLEDIRWSLLRRLRCGPAAMSYPLMTNFAETEIGEEVRAKPYSALDCYVRRSCKDAWRYRRIVTELFLAERFTFGFQAIWVLDWLFRGLLLWTVCEGQLKWTQNDFKTAILEPTAGVIGVVLKLFAFQGVHFWSLLKGF